MEEMRERREIENEGVVKKRKTRREQRRKEGRKLYSAFLFLLPGLKTP